MKKTIAGALMGAGVMVAALLMAGCLIEESVRTVSVFDSQGHPLEGANVILAGRTGVARSMTRADGLARVAAEESEISLVISRPGYKMLQMPPTTNMLIRVVLEQE